MHKSTNPTVAYLTRKKEIEQAISWYQKTISSIEKQQSERRRIQSELVEELYNLERNYYGA